MKKTATVSVVQLTGDREVCLSYGVPVAAFVPGYGYVKTDRSTASRPAATQTSIAARERRHGRPRRCHLPRPGAEIAGGHPDERLVDIAAAYRGILTDLTARPVGHLHHRRRRRHRGGNLIRLRFAVCDTCEGRGSHVAPASTPTASPPRTSTIPTSRRTTTPTAMISPAPSVTARRPRDDRDANDPAVVARYDAAEAAAYRTPATTQARTRWGIDARLRRPCRPACLYTVAAAWLPDLITTTPGRPGRPRPLVRAARPAPRLGPLRRLGTNLT